MAATPKHRRPASRKGSTRSHTRAQKPELKRLASGRLVPMHKVTPENPEKNGVRFLRAKKKK